MTLCSTLSAFLNPRDSRPTHEWAHENVSTYPPLSKHGQFDTSESRHFIAPFDALDDERTREVNILKPVRGGGSLIGDVWCVSILARRPGSYMAVHQTDPDALMMWNNRQKKMLYGCEAVVNALPLLEGKWKWDDFELMSGHPVYHSGPALSAAQSKAIKFMRQEECWMWPPGRMGEFEGRMGDYIKQESSKILRISQGGPPQGQVLDGNEWYNAYYRGTVHEWEVMCIHCASYFDPVFSGVRQDGSFYGITWDSHKLENGDWDVKKCVATVRFECPHCRKPILDGPRTKQEWNRTGRYRIIGEDDRKRVSFHWETVIDFPWQELVQLWLDAENAFKRGNVIPKLQFYQKRRAIFKDEASLLRGGFTFKRSVYELTDWKDEVVRFLTIDKQNNNMYWWSVRAWSKDKSRRIAFGSVFGEDALIAIRERFKVPSGNVLVDSAFQPKGDKGVYAMCCRNGWQCVRGDDRYEYRHLEHRDPRNRKSPMIEVRHSYSVTSWVDPEVEIPGAKWKKAPLTLFSKAQMNEMVHQLIQSGQWEEPLTGETKDIEQEYNSQMSNRVRLVDEKGKVTWTETQNDHARDLANMQCLAAIMFKCAADPASEILAEGEKK